MAPWPGRTVSTDLSESLDSPNLNIRHISPNSVRDPSLFSDADILEYSYGIPTLYPSPDNHQSPSTPPEERRPSRHGRSMSHPFPSIFHSKKKRQGGNTTLGHDVSDSDGSPILLHHQSSPKGIAGKTGRNSEKDLMTGKCMTCDSMVRWPKELSVFRCTVCLTINDLSPIGNRPRGHEQRRNGTSSFSTGPNPWHLSKGTIFTTHSIAF
jgi:E3 ubiquitin-protein ligase HECTD2